MTSNFDEREQIRFLSTAARLANRERVPRVDEVWMRGILDRLTPAQIPESGFPAAPVGDARDRNNLRRTNWFNGRYLTAEALSRQDVYFDHRSRLNAHALMPGIAWGLGIEGNGLNQLQGEQLKNGFSKNGLLTLRRGLAFDGVGRPIVVSQDFRFTLEDLIGVSLKTPRRVVGDGREFTPCVCLAPDPGGPSGGSAALPSGPYLLVIEAGELPEGRARVTGDVCGGRRSAPCEADVWQGSFGLSLVRFLVDVPLLNDISDVWALRGTLSAYYFDVFEHKLWQRWDSGFPLDGSFSRDSGPWRHEGMAIPLALVHLGEDNTALYLDSWIPRRLITGTPGEDWHRTHFGAPPRAATWARIHQFQTMLQESLAVWPMGGNNNLRTNLHARGFRHIPPIGFLPVQAEKAKEETSLGTRTAMVKSVLRQAKAYFDGTNVVAYGVVALHDDDILEDLANVMNKDPLQLESLEHQGDHGFPSESGATGITSLLKGSNKALLFLAELGDALRSKGLNIDALVNRHTEVVKLMVPLQGIARRHPLLGFIRDDAAEQARAWGLPDLPDAGAVGLADLPQRSCVNVIPRSHVVYVKQRQVLLDLVFKMVELLQAMVKLLVIAREQKSSTSRFARSDSESTMTRVFETKNYRAALQSLCENDQQLIKDVLRHPLVIQLVGQTFYRVAPNLFQGNRSQAFLDQVEKVSLDLPAPIGTLKQRQALALAQVVDDLAAEYPEAQVLQLLAALQPAELTLELVQKLGTASGPVFGPTVADGLDLQPPASFGSRTERVLYAGARLGLEERPIKDLFLDLPEGSRLPDTALVASLTVADVLARSPEDAAKVLGGAGNVAAFTKAFLNDRQAALDASTALADGVPAAVVAKVEAEVAAGQKPDAVLEQLKTQEEAKPEAERDTTLLRNLEDASTLVRVSGNRLDVLRPLQPPPGG